MAEKAGELPFVEPMLAKLGDAFDSDDHLFEVKWDGFRIQAVHDSRGLRLWTRNRNDYTARFAALGALAGLPVGTVLDGEVIALADAGPDFEQLLHRAGSAPLAYVAFDLLYLERKPWLELPLWQRREQLTEVIATLNAPDVVLSDGVTSQGRRFFSEVTARGLEGVVAKRLDGRYEPGQRSGAWTKCKRTETIVCAVVGFIAEGNDLRSLALAAQDDDGILRYVGRVGSGLDLAARAALHPRLVQLLRETPLIECDEPATWVEPGIYCVVRFNERMKSGHLRAPVFVGLAE